MNKIIKAIKMKTLPILRRHEIARAGIFGSYARGEQKKNSDIDMLVKVKKGFSLLDLTGLQFELEKQLKKKVDLLTYNSLHHLIKDDVLKDEIRII